MIIIKEFSGTKRLPKWADYGGYRLEAYDANGQLVVIDYADDKTSLGSSIDFLFSYDDASVIYIYSADGWDSRICNYTVNRKNYEDNPDTVLSYILRRL